MKIIDQSYEIILLADFTSQTNLIEKCGRIAYQSEDKMTEDSATTFVSNIRSRNHGAVLEHSMMTVKFVTDRGVSHELVRHRLASFTQESTRYCNYNKDKFGNTVTFIRPVWFDMDNLQQILKDIENPHVETIYSGNSSAWVQSMWNAERTYLNMISNGLSPQQARAVLPNSLKTTIAMTANFREWLHVFKLRGIEKAAHPQIRALILPLYQECRQRAPHIFDLGDPE